MKKIWTLSLLILLIIPVFSQDVSYNQYYNLYKNRVVRTEYAEKLDVHSYVGEEPDAAPDEYFLQDKKPIILPKTGATWKVSVPESGLYTFF
ncbi:MAG TPA: hypothetical protein PKX45_10365, partial [Bacillota bacterium]|nr:hypothetical protein [Bacillota bacterium]